MGGMKKCKGKKRSVLHREGGSIRERHQIPLSREGKLILRPKRENKKVPGKKRVENNTNEGGGSRCEKRQVVHVCYGGKKECMERGENKGRGDKIGVKNGLFLLPEKKP